MSVSDFAAVIQRKGGSLSIWGISSAGRAPALHAGGQEFESPILHHKKPNDICYSVFYFVWVRFDEKLPMYKVHFKGVRRILRRLKRSGTPK